MFKFKLFSISLIAIWIVLFVKNIDIPIYIGPDPVFVGWNRIISYRNFIAIGSGVMFIVASLSIVDLKYNLKGSPDGLAIKIETFENKNCDYINTLATIITFASMIIVQTETFRDFLISLFLIALIIICYWKTNLYYSNPIFAILGYNLYILKSEKTEIPNNSIVIIDNQLKKDDYVSYYHISDNVYFLVK